MLLLLFLLAALCGASAGMATTLPTECALTFSEWQRIQTAFASADYVANLTAMRDCTLANNLGLLPRLSLCTQTLESIVQTRFGESAQAVLTPLVMAQFSQFPLPASKLLLAITDTPVNTLVLRTLCDYKLFPTCPQFSGLGAFAGINSCLWGNSTLQGKTRSEYFDTQADIEGCTKGVGVGTFCTQFATSKTCPATVERVFGYIYSDAVHSCENAFAGANNVRERCEKSWADTFLYYCPPPEGFGLVEILLLALLTPFVLFTTIFVACYARRHQSNMISKKEVLEDLEKMEGSMARIQFHPELSTVMAQTSKYKGLQFDVNSAMWICIGTGQRFAKEKDAAQAAYLHSVAVSNNSPRLMRGKQLVNGSSSPVFSSAASMSASSLEKADNAKQTAMVVSDADAAAAEEPWIREETEEEKHARRIKQLIGFYEYWDADREDIPGHVENLFKRHNFVNVSRAVMTKFGVLPPGWEMELQQQQG